MTSIWVGTAASLQLLDEALGTLIESREREGERPWDKAKRAHWFWSEVWKARRSFWPVILAAMVINLLALAVPLFTMNVYDRVVPNQAIETLWVLSIGIVTVFGFDLLMKTLRGYFVDVAGKRADIIVDFAGAAPGDTLRMLNNLQPPFGGPIDPNTVGQIMEFRLLMLTRVD